VSYPTYRADLEATLRVLRSREEQRQGRELHYLPIDLAAYASYAGVVACGYHRLMATARAYGVRLRPTTAKNTVVQAVAVLWTAARHTTTHS
jgi:hypothetical protein